MLTLANPVITPRMGLPIKRQPVRSRKPIRSVKVQASMIPPDAIDYAQFQVVAWVLPMTIAGRLMKMEYPEIASGLVLMAVTKSILNAAGIIHY
jgi:hypothetical protein|tara:strand:- start:1112 stop:1393 length:282 start_codon:yes stop_codon:yes gene_type:complete